MSLYCFRVVQGFYSEVKIGRNNATMLFEIISNSDKFKQIRKISLRRCSNRVFAIIEKTLYKCWMWCNALIDNELSCKIV